MAEQSTVCFLCNFYFLLILFGGLIVYLVGIVIADPVKNLWSKFEGGRHTKSSSHRTAMAALHHPTRH